MTSTTTPPAPWTEESLPTTRWAELSPARHSPTGFVERDDGYWTTTDHQRLYWQAWFDDNPDNQRGTVALIHGYGEHSSRYDHIACAMVIAGYNVIAIDARGHGHSTGRRGYVERFARYVDDLSELKRRALDRWPDHPLFILGHSNGGLIALRYALRKPDGVSGFILSSPLCALAIEVSAPKKILARMTSRLLPSLLLSSGITAEMVSQLPHVIQVFDEDPLIFNTANARWFTEADNAMRDLLHRAPDLDQPFLFLISGQDRIVNPSVTQALFHRLGSRDRELELFSQLRHEIFNERPWPSLLTRAILWMENRRPHP